MERKRERTTQMNEDQKNKKRKFQQHPEEYDPKQNVVIYNQRIAIHANRKELQKAKELFQTIKQYNIANKHTYSIMMNVAIRCGQLSYAIELFQEMKQLKFPYYKDIVIYTTLLKGYCQEQSIQQAYQLYQEMIQSPVSLQPNIRTINTLLRGCVQTGQMKIAEIIITQYQKEFHQLLDCNAWESWLFLLGQAYSFSKIYPILGRLKKEFSIVHHEEYTLLPIYMNLVKALVIIQDWKGLLKWIVVMKELFDQYEKYMIRQEEKPAVATAAAAAAAAANEEKGDQTASIVLMGGGKRGWKQCQSEGSNGKDEKVVEDNEGAGNEDQFILARREESLTIYRTHLLEEWKYEVDLIEKVLAKARFTVAGTVKSDPLEKVLFFYDRILCFDQESINLYLRSVQKDENNAEITPQPSPSVSSSHSDYFKYHLFQSIQEKFGLKQLFQHFTTTSTTEFPLKTLNDCNKWYDTLVKQEFESFLPSSNLLSQSKKKNKNKNKPSTAPPKQAVKVERVTSPADRYLLPIIESLKSYFPSSDHHFICLEALFANLRGKYDSLKYNLEICSGNGDWAIEQARNDPTNAWMTMELRTDRVYHTFYKAYLAEATNLAMMNGNAFYVIPHHIPPNSIHHIFINHPEPPQQTSSQQSSDADHLLTAAFFRELERILIPDKGMITIVTDNLWYGKLLVHLLYEAIYVQHNLSSLKPFQRAASSSSSVIKRNSEKKTNQQKLNSSSGLSNEIGNAWNIEYSQFDVILYEGEPGQEAGHIVANASSYFDRLWKRSDLKKRYFVVLTKSVDGHRAKRRIIIPPVDESRLPATMPESLIDNKRKHVIFAEPDERSEAVSSATSNHGLTELERYHSNSALQSSSSSDSNRITDVQDKNMKRKNKLKKRKIEEEK